MGQLTRRRASVPDVPLGSAGTTALQVHQSRGFIHPASSASGPAPGERPRKVIKTRDCFSDVAVCNTDALQSISDAVLLNVRTSADPNDPGTMGSAHVTSALDESPLWLSGLAVSLPHSENGPQSISEDAVFEDTVDQDGEKTLMLNP